MIGDLYFMAGGMILAAILLASWAGHALSGIAYPGVPTPLLPDGPIRQFIYADIAFLAVCGLLKTVGV